MSESDIVANQKMILENQATILKNQEDLVVKRDVATPLQKRLWKRGRAL